jgi:hypothetical protein
LETGTIAEPPKPRPKPPREEREPEPEPDSHDEPARDEDDDEDYRERRPLRRRRSSGGALTGLSIAMMVIFGLGLLLDLFNCVYAIAGPEPVQDPAAPKILQDVVKNTHGPVAASMQGVLAIIAMVTIVGAIQMLRRKTWGLALTACILSTIHFGRCCCIPGAVVGIWALILLVNPDVKETFS